MPAKASKGLGKGLDALFGEGASSSSNDFEYVPISKIEPRSDQPRTLFEQAPLEELAESIREHGVLQPLTVRAAGNGFYQIIAGERRWRAARLAGLAELPARVVTADDRAATELALIENLQREDLNPLEEAAGYRVLMEDFTLTQEETAKRMGKSRPHIANALRLLALPERLADYVRSGALSAGSARALLAIKNEKSMLMAASEVINNGLSVRETERLVKRMTVGAPARAKKKDEPGLPAYHVEALEQELTRTMGRRVKIISGRNKGKVEIEYYDNEDFDRLLQALMSYSEGAR
ncbi:MAG: ParB/RepB/Spo0J family partition protein [Oscillospiraceae bacterium]|jgi:ParB family chromosome partitioning protein|nr:ParB/RepB/Spo0J family partition protein [Oscillospiraceae bacterium]